MTTKKRITIALSMILPLMAYVLEPEKSSPGRPKGSGSGSLVFMVSGGE